MSKCIGCDWLVGIVGVTMDCLNSCRAGCFLKRMSPMVSKGLSVSELLSRWNGLLLLFSEIKWSAALTLPSIISLANVQAVHRAVLSWLWCSLVNCCMSFIHHTVQVSLSLQLKALLKMFSIFFLLWSWVRLLKEHIRHYHYGLQDYMLSRAEPSL